jgi:hypothetical protein
MGKKITQYPNNVSTNPDNLSLLDLSEKTGASTFESRKWNLTAFKAWVNSWVVAGSVTWNDITGKPTGTVNKVAKFTTTTDIGDSTITDDGTLVGISQAVPTAKLHINNTTGSNSILVEDDTNVDATPFVINNVGNVGIGVTSPIARLHINSGTNKNIVVTPSLNGTKLASLDDAGSAYSETEYDASVQRFLIGGVETVTMASNNNVGISTTSPTAKLHVLNAGTDDSFRVDDQTTDTTPFIIKNDGKVGIGTTVTTFSTVTVSSTQQNGINITNTNEASTGITTSSTSNSAYAKGADFDASVSSTAGWVKGVVGRATANNYAYSIGGEFSADSVTGQDYAVGVKAVATSTQFTKYCFWGQDGSQGLYKFLRSVTADGKANWDYLPTEIQFAVSDETTALTAGTAKITFRMPYTMYVTEVRASLTTAQTSGNIFTIDINEGGLTGNSILSTKLTIDNGSKTSVGATTPYVISDNTLTDDFEITIDIDQIGDGTAKGLKVLIKGLRIS